MKYSHITAALAVTAASSSAFAPQSFTQRVGRQQPSSTELFYKDENGDFDKSDDTLKKVASNKKNDESEQEPQFKTQENEIGLEKNIAKMLKLGVHIVNPLRTEPLTERQKMIKEHVVDPIAKLSGGCALIGATGVLATVGAVKLTSDALNQNFPETFGHKEPIERVNKAPSESAYSSSGYIMGDSYATKIAREHLYKSQQSHGQSIFR